MSLCLAARVLLSGAVSATRAPLVSRIWPSTTTRSPSSTPDFDRSAVALDADQLDVAHLHRLVVLDDEDERTLLTALNGHGRNHHGVGPDIQIDLDIHIHAGPQLQLPLTNLRLGRDGAGVGIDTAVDEVQRAGLEGRARSRRVDPHRRRRRASDALRRAARSRSASVKPTRIGWICVMVTRPADR